MLLVDRERLWSAEELADQLWPAGPPQQWRPAVRALVSRVRALLHQIGVPGDAIVSRAGRYHVDLPDLAVDLEIARRRVERAAQALAEGRYDVADQLAGRARAVLSQPVLAGVEAPWAEELRQATRPHLVDSQLLLGQARRCQGRWSAARLALTEALRRSPFREEVWRELMMVEAAAGNAATALGLYEECRRQLAQELGADPSPETQDLHTSILRGLPVGASPPSAPGRAASHGPTTTRVWAPYVGLRPFEQVEADRFFGRDALVQQLVEKLGEHRAVAVVGPSGSGKSSLVRAGLLPALAAGAIPNADTWPVMVLVPGRDPLDSLAGALTEAGIDARGTTPGPGRQRRRLADALAADPSRLHLEAERLLASRSADPTARVLLVLDQAEELFTVADAPRADCLLAALRSAIRRRTPWLRVVATLRADFYAHAARNPDMAALLSRSQLVVPPMSGAELEAAVVGPAALAGATLERGVVGRIVDDATGEPGRLPLLQHTLWELWSHRDGSVLTVAGYEQIGGLAGALAKHAERTWLSVSDPAAARGVLLRGVAPGGRDREDTRRPIHRHDLVSAIGPASLDAVLEHLVSHRLLQARTSGEQVVYELAHEALITEWPRLNGWVSQKRQHLATARAIETAAQRWLDSGQDHGWLLTGQALAEARTMRAAVDAGDLDLALSQAEAELVAASEAEAAVEAAARRVERGLAASRLHLVEDPELALLLGLGMLRDVVDLAPERTADLAALLRGGIHRQRLVRRMEGRGALLAVSADGTLMALADPPGATARPDGPVEIRIHRMADEECLARLPGHVGDLLPRAAFSPDGARLVSGDGHGRIRIWCATTGRLEAEWPGPDGPVGGVDVAAGTGYIATWAAIGHDRQLVVFDPEGRHLHEMAADGRAAFEEDLPRPGRLVAFNPAGDRLLAAVGDVARRLDLIDVATWERVVSTNRPTSSGSTLNLYREVTSLEWHPDGSHVAVSLGPTTQILDGETLQVLRSAHSDTRASVAWSPEGGRVITAGRSVSFLDRRDPDPELDTPAPPVRIRPTHPSPDRLRVRRVPGTDLVVLGAEGSGDLDLHDVSVAGPAEVANLAPMLGQGVAWSPDGCHLAFGRGGGELAIVDSSTWAEVTRYTAHTHDHAWPRLDGPIAWSPDGSFLASTANDGTLAMRDLARGTTTTVAVGGASNWPGTVGITPDSRHIAAVATGRAVVARRDGTVVASLDVPTGGLGIPRLSADGTQLAIPNRGRQGRAVSATWTTHLWRWGSDEPPRTLGPPGSRFGECLSFHPDGQTVAFASDDPIVWIVDAHTGAVLRELAGHALPIQDVMHHPSGRMLASSSWDRTVRVWDLATGSEVAMIASLTGPPSILAFHPTRPWLAVADWTGVVRVWTLDFDELVAIARSRVTRGLSDEELTLSRGS
nr:BTAD domain-containing putative transcriptional regulator [Ornithinimicrobium sediminis]